MTTALGATSLVGRDREVDALREAIGTAAAGHGRVVLLEGEPGIGKSRLMDTAARHARSIGFEVVHGVCDDLGAPRPFAALVDAFGIVPGLEREGAGAAPGQQYRVVDAFASEVEQRAARQPLLLAIDDLQWADASTLVALRSIARRAATLPVLIVTTNRSGHDVLELHRVTDDLLRAGATRLSVGSLDQASLEALLTELLAGRPSETLLSRIEGAGGNPLFVIEYVRAVQAGGGGDAGGGEGDTSTALEFRLTVLRRLAALPEAVGETLRLASVLGSTFSAGDLAVATGKPVIDLAPTLHQAVVSSLLEERGDQLAFRHGLVRDAIYEHIPLAVRRRLHREVGQALAGAGSDALAVAQHLGLGADAEDPEAVDWLRKAAREAASRSPGAAVELLRRARGLLGPTSPERDPLLAELAVALAWSGQLGEAEALSTEVLGRRPGPDVAGPLRCSLVYALTWQGRPVEALRHATLEPDERLSDWDAALLRAEAATASLFAFDMKGAMVIAGEAVEAAERLGHEVALCTALSAHAWAHVFAGRFDLALEISFRAIEIADNSVGGQAHVAHPRFFPAIPLLGFDRLDDAERTLREGLRVAEELGLAWSFPLYHAFLGCRGFVAGDWDAAVTECETALAVADEVGLHIGTIAATSGWLAAIQVHRDDLPAAERTIATAMGRLAQTGPQLGMGILNFGRALVHEARGELDAAITLLQATIDMYVQGGAATGDSWSGTTFVRMCVAAGQPERAALLIPERKYPQPEPGPMDSPVGRAMVARGRGLVDGDVDELLAAVDLYRQSRRPLELAEACEEAAGLLAAAQRMGEAVALWDEAVSLFEAVGAERDLARIAADLRRHGVKRGSRRRHVRASSGWESLTETEHKVVALVAQRLSNPEVAERLFVSRHTIESHLKHIYRKLSLSSRLELAAAAQARTPESPG